MGRRKDQDKIDAKIRDMKAGGATYTEIERKLGVSRKHIAKVLKAPAAAPPAEAPGEETAAPLAAGGKRFKLAEPDPPKSKPKAETPREKGTEREPTPAGEEGVRRVVFRFW